MRLERREALILGAVGLAAAAAGVLIGPIALESRSGASELLAAKFVDLRGRPRSLADWKGRLVLINFWATWCPPCREEIPLLMAARDQFASNGVEIVGIGVDSVDNITKFAKAHPFNYPILITGRDPIELMHALGNGSGALPYTVLLDRKGAIAYRKLGAFRGQELTGLLRGALGS